MKYLFWIYLYLGAFLFSQSSLEVGMLASKWAFPDAGGDMYTMENWSGTTAATEVGVGAALIVKAGSGAIGTGVSASMGTSAGAVVGVSPNKWFSAAKSTVQPVLASTRIIVPTARQRRMVL